MYEKEFDMQSVYGGQIHVKLTVDAIRKKIQLFSEDDEYPGQFWPYATANVHVDGLREGEYAIKNYSENEGILNVLIDRGIVKEPHRVQISGFIALPICYLSDKVVLNA